MQAEQSGVQILLPGIHAITNEQTERAEACLNACKGIPTERLAYHVLTPDEFTRIINAFQWLSRAEGGWPEPAIHEIRELKTLMEARLNTSWAEFT